MDQDQEPHAAAVYARALIPTEGAVLLAVDRAIRRGLECRARGYPAHATDGDVAVVADEVRAVGGANTVDADAAAAAAQEHPDYGPDRAVGTCFLASGGEAAPDRRCALLAVCVVVWMGGLDMH